MALKAKKHQLKLEMERITEEVSRAEKDLLEKLDQKTSLKSDTYSIQEQVTERRFPSWKEHFISFAGKGRADDIIADTEPKVYRSVLIKKHAA